MPIRTLTVAGRKLTLDARPDRLDLRDLPYRPPVASLPPEWPTPAELDRALPAYLKSGLILDQGREGACTGFGLAAVVNYLLWQQAGQAMGGGDRVSPRMLYHLARFYDEWPGEDYEGSSCRGALKGWHRHGVCRDALWPYRPRKNAPPRFIRPKDGWDTDALTRPLGVYYRVERRSVVDIQAAIHHAGAVYASANVHAGWGVRARAGTPTHRNLPVIRKKQPAGGHAFALVGYNATGFVVQNSWGEDWGASGFAVLPYDDWVENGTDAWVVSMGVPVSRAGAGVAAPEPRRYFVESAPTEAPAGWPSWLGGRKRDPLEGRADVWTREQAYWHTLVTGNDGNVINRLPHVADEGDATRFVCHEQPLAWFKQRGARDPRRLVVYAHGGLNAESDSIQRIRALGPCFQENGVYPVFTTWRSGWAETINDMITDGVKRVFGQPVPVEGFREEVAEAWDRTVEITLRHLLVKGMWSEMKENVKRGGDTGRGLDVLADRLAALAADLGGRRGPEIHLVGHSAGSFVCGRLLKELRDRSVPVASCTLYAPACDLAFAREFFQPAIADGQLSREAFHIHLLSDPRELDDTVGPYRKSLLYLVSRALERHHKTPLLGLAASFDADRASREHWHEREVDEARQWQAFFWEKSPPAGIADRGGPRTGKNLHVLADRQVSVGPRRIQSSHGCFDNSVQVIRSTVTRITGGPPKRPITNLDY